MKRLFMFELGYKLCLHVFGPLLYYKIRGEYINIYNYCPETYMNQAAVIIAVPILLVMTLVAILPIGRGKIGPSIDRRANIWFYAGCLFIFLQHREIGAYTNSAILAGTMWAYFSFLFDLGVLFYIFSVAGSERSNIIVMGIVYVFVTLMASSRQGALILVAALVAMLISTDKYRKQRKAIYLFILCMCLAAPFGYYYATANRGGYVPKKMEMVDQIVGRCSNLEVLGIALYQRDNDLWEEDIFEEKYALDNQIKLCVNSLVIGNVFEDDVKPNQYYRTIFLEVPKQQSKDTYTSINLSLSGYLYLKYPLVVSWIFTMGILLFIYILISMTKLPQMLSVTIAIFLTNSFLDYFDWVQILTDCIRYLLTVGTFFIVNLIIVRYVPKIKAKRIKFKII